MAIYNYGFTEATINVDILESSSSVPDYVIPDPIECGDNAFCDEGVCLCNEGYLPNPTPEDACIFHSCDEDIITCQVS